MLGLSACDGVNTLYFVFEEREIVSTVVEVLHKFVTTQCEGLVGGPYMS